MDFKNLFGKFFKDSRKVMFYMVIAVIVGVIFILVGDVTSNLNSNKNKTAKASIEVDTNAEVTAASSSYDDKIKKELVDTLSQIQGVGKVSVMIYFTGGTVNVPAVNVNDTQTKIDEKDGNNGTRVTNETTKNESVVILNDSGGSKPFILKSQNPEIGGVMVVAEGAENQNLKKMLESAVQTVLSIPEHKVYVVPMKKR